MNDTPSSVPSENVSGSIETLSSGVTREWIYDRQIVVYTVNDVRRESLDVWTDAFKSDINSWPADRLFRVIQDLRLAGGITPYGRTKAQEMFQARPDVRVWSALVLPSTFVNNLIRLFVRAQNNPNTMRVREFFRTREDALTWLLRKN
jgi:hypothetical protein